MTTPGWGLPTQSAPPPEPKDDRPWPWRHPWKASLISLAIFIVGLFVILAATVPGGTTAKGTGATPTASVPDSGTTNAPPTPAPSPPAETSPFGLEVGEPMDLSDDTGDIGSITVTKVIATTNHVAYGESPKHGEYLIVKVRADATGELPVYEGDFYVTVHGQHYEEGNGNSFEATNADTLGYVNLHNGEHVSGPIVFDIPLGVHGHIVYDPNFEGPAIGYWRF